MSHDPSAVAVKNGQLFGLNVPFAEAKIVAMSIPWDVTTSYRPGTVHGPEAIVAASYQLDLSSPLVSEGWKLPLHYSCLSDAWKYRSYDYRKISAKLIEALERGESLANGSTLLVEVNQVCEELYQESYQKTLAYLDQDKAVLTLGGDHAVSLGPIQAYTEKYPQLSILHFDAHADLRQAYEGFSYSHASIMFNVLEKCSSVQSLVQVGIRDYAPCEWERICSDQRIHTFFDWDLKLGLSEGKTWKELASPIIERLGPQVYISFDIDALDPKLCPHTGTPVPGGLELWQAQQLIQWVIESGRRIVGADLVEVAPGPEGDQWDGNVGARMAFFLACAIWRSFIR